MKKSLRIILVAMLLLFPVAAVAASFTVSAPRQVIKGRQFQVTYTLENAEGSNIKAADIPGAKLLFGPSESSSYSMSIINGKREQKSTVEYTYTYRAEKEGKYNIKGATINVGGKAISSQGFTIEILPPDKNADNSSNSRGSVHIDDISSQSADRDVSANDVFVRIILSKPSVYEQEATVCTIKLYTKYQISQFAPTLQPSFNGFLIEDLPIKGQINDIENVNGQNYMVAELKRCILYPQQSGKLTITSGNYDLTVVQYIQHRTMFGFMREPIDKQIKVRSNSAQVTVKPLPSPRPAGFNGAVGKFNISTELKPDKFKTNEAASYIVTISGTGNIKYVKSPDIAFPSQLDVYDPQTTINANPNGNNVSGNTKFEYTFVPQYVGDFEIPAPDFVYFDPAAGKYVTLSTKAYNLKVEKGVGSSSSASATDKKNILQKNKDILHIKTGNFALTRNVSFIVDSPAYWLWYLIPVLILASVIIVYRKQLKARSNVALMRTRRANKVAQKRLRTAKEFMKKHDSNGFFNEVLKAVWGYLSDKLNIPGSELNKENIASNLAEYGADQQLVDDIMRLLDDCEFAQYAPSQDDSRIGETYDLACDVMDRIENIKRRNK